MNLDEARLALVGGADILDVKNPSEGSLGANFPKVIRSVAELASGKVPVSAAIGDFDFKPGTASLAALGAAYSGAEYIKVGLLGIENRNQAREMIESIVEAVKDFDDQKKVVAAAYSDHVRVGSIPPLILPEVASRSGADVVMVDTAIKDGRATFEFMSEEELCEFITTGRELGLEVAVAGTIGFEHLEILRRISPDIIGVRGIVCGGDRGSQLRSELVRELKLAIS